MFVDTLTTADVAERLFKDQYAAWGGDWPLCREVAAALEEHYNGLYGEEHHVEFYPTDIRCDFYLWDPVDDSPDDRPDDADIVAKLSKGLILARFV